MKNEKEFEFVVRIPAKLHAALWARKERIGIPPAEQTRRALEQYVKRGVRADCAGKSAVALRAMPSR